VPKTDTCGLCVGGEACNGRDDNCNGAVDENDVCGGGAWCFVDGPGCGEGLACAGTRCIQSCEDDEDCDESYTCLMLKDQYGNYGVGTRGCVISGAGEGCAVGCAVLASSVDDETLAAFVECMDDGNAPCSEAMQCMVLLPINF